ncbi:MAG TPA: hypothetical protein VFH31_17560 [Pyrinomonadaceae bacterium]|nr:hypothetical protein [Pyrinomonadaceae bacterium]
MIGTSFIGLYPFQWIAMIVVALTLLILADASAGHYRSGFVFRSQYAPFISGGILIVTAILATLWPQAEWTSLALSIAGWLAVVSGVVGFAFHHYYGIVKKPGGYKWLLHYLMYGAPQLAPLALALTGVLALLAAYGLANEMSIAGVSVRNTLLALVAVAFTGASLQAGILHYRGAFNNPLMYAPLIVPMMAVVMSIWMIVSPNSIVLLAFTILLWLTFLMGFIGLGMHLRGFGRQMGGLYVTIFNWLEGPPAFAPALFTGFAGVGLIAAYFL